MNPPSRLDSILQPHQLLRYNEEYGVIICLTCNKGYPLKYIGVHLGCEHHITQSQYNPILQSFNCKTMLAEDWKDLPPPPDDILSIEGLLVMPGYFCTGCGHWTMSYDIMKNHLKCADEVCQVQLQYWNRNSPSRNPTAMSRYWIVTNPSVDSDNSSVGMFSLNSLYKAFFVFICF